MKIDPSRCPSCEAPGSSVRLEVQEFAYGLDAPVMLKAVVPVRTCLNSECGLEWTDYHGEKRREAAVEAHEVGDG